LTRRREDDPVTDPNVNRPEWEHERRDLPFRRRVTGPGSRSGASEIGVSLYEIDPGGAIAPYHIHHGNEELLLVLSGTPQLRTPDDGVRTLEASALVAFPRGPAGVHRIANHSPEPASAARSARRISTPVMARSASQTS
jgi:uncharacterized cupin superfamily protein